MKRTRIVIPEQLARWIKSNMPEAPDPEAPPHFCGDTIPFDWLPGNRKKYIGITLWNEIYLREPFELNSDAGIELLLHELVHVRQFARNPFWFPLRFLFFLTVKGYRNHPAEIEARAVAAEMMDRFIRDGRLKR